MDASARVALDGLERCRTAFSQLALYRPESREHSAPLLTLIDEIEEGMRRTLRREGIDE